MSVDVVDLRSFYQSPLGHVARRTIARCLDRHWGAGSASGVPAHTGLRVAGFGYATPYLGSARASAERVLAFMPANQGVVNWPSQGLSASSLVDLTMLPLPDASIDRVLMVHAIEAADSADELLHEAWRILTPGGRLVVVAPNRRCLWARMDTTPFGFGRPFSRSQLRQLLRETLFSPESWSEILYLPPFPGRTSLALAGAWEAIGTTLSLPFAGLHVVDATKQLYRAVPVRRARRVMRPAPVLVPAPAPGLSAGRGPGAP